MKKRFKAQVLLLAVSAMTIAAAAYAVEDMKWSSARTVTKVMVEADHNGSTVVGDTFVEFSSPPHSTPCSKNSTGTWVVGGTQDSQKALAQIALSAKLSGQQVRVLWNAVHSGSQACNGQGYPIIRGLELQP